MNGEKELYPRCVAESCAKMRDQRTMEQFELLYQPVFEADAGRVVLSEALLRWNHPQYGALLPESFMQAFIDNGFAEQLDEFVLEQVCSVLESGDAGASPISVNLTARSLGSYGSAGRLLEIVKRHALPEGSLYFEVTEEAYLKMPGPIIRNVELLEQAGMKIIIDSFGDAAAPLTALRDIPAAYVKLDADRLLGRKLNRGRTLLSALVEAAARLDCALVAKQVESREQFDFVKSIGFGLIQGYFLKEPVSARELAQMCGSRVIAKPYARPPEQELPSGVLGRMLDNVPTPIASVLFDTEGKGEGLWANRAMLELLGAYDAGEMLKKLEKENRQSYAALMRWLTPLGKSGGDGSYNFLTTVDGQPMRLKLNARLFSVGAGRRRGFITAENEGGDALDHLSDTIDRSWRTALTGSDIYIFEYDAAAGRCEGVPVKGRSGETITVENVPESVIAAGQVHADSVAELRKIYRKLRAGRKEASCELQMLGDGQSRWALLRYSAMRGEGCEGRYIGVVTDITNEKRMEQRYREQLNYMEEVTKTAAASVRLNLSRNSFSEFRSAYPHVQRMAVAEDAEGFFELMCRQLPAEADRERFVSIFSRQTLISDFSGGVNHRSMEFLLNIEPDYSIWVQCQIRLLKNPYTGDVEAFMYATDVNERTITRIVLDRMIKLEYERVSYVDSITGIGRTLYLNDDNSFSTGSDYDYEMTLERMVLTGVVGEEQDRVMSKLSLRGILSGLEEKDVYTVSYETRNAQGRKAIRTVRSFYVDRQRGLFCQARMRSDDDESNRTREDG